MAKRFTLYQRSQDSGVGYHVQCSICNQFGHNRRSHELTPEDLMITRHNVIHGTKYRRFVEKER